MPTITWSYKSSGGSANWSSWTQTPTSPATETLSGGIPQTTLPTNNKNITASGNKFTLSGTWVSLFAVPAGAIITGVTAASCQSKCTVFTTGGTTHTADASTLVDGATTITLSASRSFTTTDASFQTSTGTDSTGLTLKASDTITLTIGCSLSNGNSNSATMVLQQDNLVFTITYYTLLGQNQYDWPLPNRLRDERGVGTRAQTYIQQSFYALASRRYWVGGTASWNATAATKWAWVSGGTGGAPVPTQADNTFFDANSGAGTVTFDATSGPLAASSLDFTGYTGTQIWGSGGNKDINLYGSLTFGSGMTLTLTSALFAIWRFQASGTITLNGKLLASTTDNTKLAIIEIVAGTLTLGDGGTFGTVKPLSGNMDWNNQSPTISSMTQVGQNGAITLTLGSGTTECWNWDASSNPANVTIVQGTSTIKMRHSVDGNGCTFDGGGLTYNNIQLRDVLAQSGQVKSSNTFNDMNVDTGSTQEWDFQHGQTQTCSTFTRSSGTGYTVTISSDDGVNPHYLFDAGGTNTVFNMTIKNSWANGGGTIWKSFVSNGNTDGGNNTGWDFGPGGEPIMGQGVN